MHPGFFLLIVFSLTVLFILLRYYDQYAKFIDRVLPDRVSQRFIDGGPPSWNEFAKIVWLAMIALATVASIALTVLLFQSVN
jgi:predicted PurR-regulated permease PerM